MNDEEIDALIETVTDIHAKDYTYAEVRAVARAAIEHGTRQALGGTLLSNAKASVRAALARELLEDMESLCLEIKSNYPSFSRLWDKLNQIAEEGQ